MYLEVGLSLRSLMLYDLYSLMDFTVMKDLPGSFFYILVNI